MERMKKYFADYSTHKIYSHIVLLTLIAHVSFTLLFGGIRIYFLMCYNIFSVLFYAAIFYTVHKKHYRLAVTAVHIEISFFVALTTLYLGWDFGYSFYLIALCSLVYFCPYRNIYIPYFFSLAELLLFLTLKMYTVEYTPLYALNSLPIETFIYCSNTIISFAVILYAAFISNLSAVFAKRELLEKNYTLQNTLNHDSLTQLLTRPYIQGKFSRLPESSFPVSVILSDIDNFKTINDTYGHPCGDYVLFTLSTIMKTICPAGSDIVRWGGEEFVIIFYTLSHEEVTENIIKLKEAVSAYNFNYADNTIHITMTFGISYAEGYSPANSLDELIFQADERLYYGKKHGKNVIISPTSLP